MMNFFETRLGRKFFEGDIPRLIKAVERVASALETTNEREEHKREARNSFLNEMWSRLLQFAREEDFGEGDINPIQKTCREQLRSLWTAYCICADWEVDTGPYDRALGQLWDALVESRNILGSSDIFYDYDCFDMFMCEELV